MAAVVGDVAAVGDVASAGFAPAAVAAVAAAGRGATLGRASMVARRGAAMGAAGGGSSSSPSSSSTGSPSLSCPSRFARTLARVGRRRPCRFGRSMDMWRRRGALTTASSAPSSTTTVDGRRAGSLEDVVARASAPEMVADRTRVSTTGAVVLTGGGVDGFAGS